MGPVNDIAPAIQGSAWVTRAVVSSDYCFFPGCDEQFPAVGLQLIPTHAVRAFRHTQVADMHAANVLEATYLATGRPAGSGFPSAAAPASTLARAVCAGSDGIQRNYWEFTIKAGATSKTNTITVSDSSASDVWEMGAAWRGMSKLCSERLKPHQQHGRRNSWKTITDTCYVVACELRMNCGVWVITWIWEGSTLAGPEEMTPWSWGVCVCVSEWVIQGMENSEEKCRYSF